MPRKRIPRDVSKARQLRDNLSLPEALLWRLLKGSPQGVHFRSQHPVGDYVLDFYCAKAKVAFEIDGIAHDMGERPARDATRDAWLRDEGIEVVRIPASEVLKSPETVAESIVRYCQRPQPLRLGLTAHPPPHLWPSPKMGRIAKRKVIPIFTAGANGEVARA